VDTHGKSGGNSLAIVVAVAVSVLVAMAGGIQLRKFIESTTDGKDDIVKEDPADNTYDADTQGGTLVGNCDGRRYCGYATAVPSAPHDGEGTAHDRDYLNKNKKNILRVVYRIL
jgi:hypothetical protein